MGDSLLTSALSLNRRLGGHRIFRLKPQGWTPAFKGWQREATGDPLQIMEWWAEGDWNIGVATGDGLVVLDVDDKPGKSGSATLEGFKLNGTTYDTFTVATPSGGRHLYYRGDEVSNTAGKLGRDLDIRSGGGYVVGPGSTLAPGTKNAAGGVYEIDRADEPRELPAFFAERLRGRERTASTARVDLDDAGAVARAVLYLTTLAPLAIENQGGDHTTFTVAAHVKDLGVSEEICCDLMSHHWNPRCEPPWDEHDLQTKVENAYAYGRSPPGVDHPAAQYAGVKLELPKPAPTMWFRPGRDSWAGSVKWLYEGMLPTTGVVILTAPSGAGKTFVATHLAKSLDDESEFFGVAPAAPGSTIYLASEAFGSIKQRLAAYGPEEWALSLAYVGALAARGAWAQLVENIQLEARALREEHGRPVRLIVLDTLSASAILEDEDNNALAATVIRLFADLSAALNALFLVVHHPPKSGVGFRGASAIGNNADYVLEIEREGLTPVRELKMVKSRDGEQRSLGCFTLVPVQIGIDDKGKPITTMTVSTSQGAGASPLRKVTGGERLAPLLVESVEWAKTPQGGGSVRIEGHDCLDYDVVYETFKGRMGKVNRSTVSRSFREALGYAQNAGALTVKAHLGVRYIHLNDIGEVP